MSELQTYPWRARSSWSLAAIPHHTCPNTSAQHWEIWVPEGGSGPQPWGSPGRASHGGASSCALWKAHQAAELVGLGHHSWDRRRGAHTASAQDFLTKPKVQPLKLRGEVLENFNPSMEGELRAEQKQPNH